MVARHGDADRRVVLLEELDAQPGRAEQEVQQQMPQAEQGQAHREDHQRVQDQPGWGHVSSSPEARCRKKGIMASATRS